jgi:hypothetical protein
MMIGNADRAAFLHPRTSPTYQLATLPATLSA